MQEFTLHDLRLFYASDLIAARCDVVPVQWGLGHASATITNDTYSHVWRPPRTARVQRQRIH